MTNANGKADNFRRLAEHRVSNILKTLHHVGNLSNRSNYDYTPDQVAKIFKSIRAETDAAEERFKHTPQTSSKGFSLD
jgi:hypothetical protein